MKYTIKTKHEWAEEMNENELIKDIENMRFLSMSLSIIGILVTLLGFIYYMFGFLGIIIMITGVEGHIRFRYCQIIKLIKKNKESKS